MAGRDELDYGDPQTPQVGTKHNSKTNDTASQQ